MATIAVLLAACTEPPQLTRPPAKDANVEGAGGDASPPKDTGVETEPDAGCVSSTEVCDGADNDCDDQIDEAHPTLGEPCQVGLGACNSSGIYRCSDDGVDVVCDAEAGDPELEQCNEQDDDCDGQTDEGTLNACGQCGPVPEEVCNEQDDDCDGQTDEGTLNACGRCGPVPEEVCNEQDDDCDGQTDEGTLNACGRCGPVPEEVCNEQDDDCDGQTDEGTLNACGRCGPVPEEVCNEQDDDCDGQTDEGFAELGTPCGTGVGACARAGLNRCGQDGASVVCDVVAGLPTDEVCDGIDNDCDGETDEAFPSLGRPCSDGQGQCLRAGVFVCADGAGVACDAEPGDPVAELCNGEDDDCDGAVDEDYGQLNTLCEVGEGRCTRAGIYRCAEGGAGVACDAQPGEPVAEACNGLDDDCDGQADEAFPDKDQACSLGVGGCARDGTFRCSDDGSDTVCDAQPGEPGGEACNGLDDDCDGRSDEDVPGAGRPCAAGAGACRAEGLTVCDADAREVVCGAQPSDPAPERCDAVDDDCDGQIDEGYGVGEACTEGVGACERLGVLVCTPDGEARCSAVPGEPALEACDGIDSDCDGEGDEVEGETTAGACRRCEADDPNPPCNGCPEGTYVPSGFVCVPAGAPARMGSPDAEDGRTAEHEAQHQVEMTRPFLLSATEVTQRQWIAQELPNPSLFVDGAGCGANCGTQPVERVSWHEALVYLNRRSLRDGLTPCYDLSECLNPNDIGAGCLEQPGCDVDDSCDEDRKSCLADYLCLNDDDLLESASIHDCSGYRLPSEAEWEYAVRAGGAPDYEAVYSLQVPWDVEANGRAAALETIAWYYHTVLSDPPRPQQVGQKQANRWGLFDMLGNVYEWTWDEFRFDRQNLQDLVDPVNPPTTGGAEATRAIRGGSFISQAGQVRSAQRSAATPNSRRHFLGFRAARSLPLQAPAGDE